MIQEYPKSSELEHLNVEGKYGIHDGEVAAEESEPGKGENLKNCDAQRRTRLGWMREALKLITGRTL
jgi:hypothetical protein